jgi:hypothetical protein
LGAILAVAMNAGGQGTAVPKRNPEVVPVLQKLGEYCTQFRKNFHNYVAEEEDTQRRYNRSGVVTGERHILADYYTVALPSDPTHQTDFREVLEVDGKKVARPGGSLMELLTTPNGNLLEEIDRLTKESARYELYGEGAFLSSVALVLPLYGLPENQEHTEYSLASKTQSPDRWVLDFKEFGANTVLRRGSLSHPEPLPATGRFYVAKADGRILRAEVSVTYSGGDGGGNTLVRYVVEYQPGSDRQMLPSRRLVFVDKSKWGRVAESEAIYSKFRRFSTNSKIVSWDAP